MSDTLQFDLHISICRIHVNLPYTMHYTSQFAMYIWDMSNTHQFVVDLSIFRTHINLPYTCQFAVYIYNARHVPICRIHYWNERHISICRIQINLPYTMSATRQLAVYNARHVPICRIHFWNERHTSIGRIHVNSLYTCQFAVSTYNARHVLICPIHFWNERCTSTCRVLFRNERHTRQFAVSMSICRVHCATHDNVPCIFPKRATHNTLP